MSNFLLLDRSFYERSSPWIWETCKAHWEAFQEEERWNIPAVIHLMIAAFEAFPVISQIISLFEFTIAWIYYTYCDPKELSIQVTYNAFEDDVRSPPLGISENLPPLYSAPPVNNSSTQNKDDAPIHSFPLRRTTPLPDLPERSTTPLPEPLQQAKGAVKADIGSLLTVRLLNR